MTRSRWPHARSRRDQAPGLDRPGGRGGRAPWRPTIAWLAAMALLSACAPERVAARSARGAALGPHMRSVQGLPGITPEPFGPWEPLGGSPVLQDHDLPQPPIGALERDWPGSPRTSQALVAQPDPLARSGAMAGAWLIFQGYKQTISRLDGNKCGFSPSCSRFGYEALSERGLWGVPLTFARLMRNHAEQDHYLMDARGYLRDPVSNYTFFGQPPELDAFWRTDDPAHAWHLHMEAVKRLEHPQ